MQLIEKAVQPNEIRRTRKTEKSGASQIFGQMCVMWEKDLTAVLHLLSFTSFLFHSFSSLIRFSVEKWQHF